MFKHYFNYLIVPRSNLSQTKVDEDDGRFLMFARVEVIGELVRDFLREACQLGCPISSDRKKQVKIVKETRPKPNNLKKIEQHDYEPIDDYHVVLFFSNY